MEMVIALGSGQAFPMKKRQRIDTLIDGHLALRRAERKLELKRESEMAQKHLSGVYSDHQALDARSLAMHCLVAKKLLANPALIDEARNTLARWRIEASDPIPAVFLEWSAVLEASAEEIAGFLASMSEDATRLRQSSPFAALLTPAERSRIFEAFRDPDWN